MTTTQIHVVASSAPNADSIKNSLFNGISLIPGQEEAELSGYWIVYNSIVSMNFVKNSGDEPVNFSADYGDREKVLLPESIEHSYNVISGSAKAYHSDYTSEGFLSDFDAQNNKHDSTSAGLSTYLSDKVSAISTSTLATGVSQPKDSTIKEVLKSSAEKRQDILNGLKRVSTSADVALMKKLSGLLQIESGSLQDIMRPLKSSEVGCSF